MVTASHNPPEYNGIKLFDRRGASVTQSHYLKLLSGLESSTYTSWDSLGLVKRADGIHSYIEHLISAAKFHRAWKVGIDPGNGTTAITAPLALTLSGATASTINIALDGTFPGRGSEPDVSNLAGLSALVKEEGLDIGFAYDGDGDRVTLVDEMGNFVEPDAALAFVAARVVSERGGGTVVVNLDTSSAVDIMVEAEGGKVIRSKVGDTFILEEITKRGGVFGGETCGAWILPAHALCPDGVLSSILLLNLLEEASIKPSSMVAGLPRLFLTRRKLACPNIIKVPLMRSLEKKILTMFPGSELNELDGLRIGMADRSWVLVRPSGTEPLVRVTSESNSGPRSRELANRLCRAVNAIKEELLRKR